MKQWMQAANKFINVFNHNSVDRHEGVQGIAQIWWSESSDADSETTLSMDLVSSVVIRCSLFYVLLHATSIQQRFVWLEMMV